MVDIEREAKGIPCDCGGYADRVQITPDEMKQYNCGRSYECCARAFVCRKCGRRYVGTADAPEVEYGQDE